ncbi:MAG: FKBP-type peptidyl-prolyl cis-trans isomerase [Ferruginibacter sp.]
MRKISFLLMAAVMLLSACKEAFKKGKDGLEYKVISGSGGAELKPGNFMQLHIGQYYNDGKKDSLLSDTRNEQGPMIQPFDSLGMPPAYFAIMKNLKKGDSLVIRLLTDSLMKKNPMGMPPFVKKGQYLVTTVKLVNIFTAKEQADSAYKAEMVLTEARMKKKAEEQLKTDDKILTDYIAKNNIKVQKSPEGAYVEIISEGAGPLIDTTVIVKTNYTGKTMDGKPFDSNTDPKFNHVEPFNVNMTNDMNLGNPVIKGWTDGLKLLKKGSRAKFYIPSTLAYGTQPPGPEIPANANLVFDIEVVDIISKEQAKAEMEVQRKKMMEMQKRYMDSISKVQADTAGKK